MSLPNFSLGFENYKLNSIDFPEDKVKGDICGKQLGTNLYLVKSSLNIKNDFSFNGKSSMEGITIFYNIQGKSRYKSVNSPSSVCLDPLKSHIFLMKEDITETSIYKGDMKSFSVTLNKDFLLENIPNSKLKEFIMKNLEKKLSYHALSEKKINLQTQLLLQDIYNTPFEGELDNIFIQSKVLELIYMEFKGLLVEDSTKIKNIKLDEQDIYAIKKAKEILLQNIQAPPSIVELAKMVSLNEFKLKVGFKKIFNNSPYNILINYRLELAKKLLNESDMNIEEISRHVGYKYPQSFTHAFIKKYNIRPIDITKTRKYYY